MWFIKLATTCLLAQVAMTQELLDTNDDPTSSSRRIRLRRPSPRILGIQNPAGILRGQPVPFRDRDTAELLATTFENENENRFLGPSKEASSALQTLLATAARDDDIPEEKEQRTDSLRTGLPRQRLRTSSPASRPESRPESRPKTQATRTDPVQTTRRYSHNNEDGSFTFGYVSEDGSFREETRGVDCITRGKYGYIDPDGKRREFTYVSGLPCDTVPEEGDEPKEGIRDPVNPSDRFKTIQAVQLSEDEIPRTNIRSRQRIQRPRSQSTTPVRPAKLSQTRSRRPNQSSVPKQDGALDNLISIANGDEFEAPLRNNPITTSQPRPRPTQDRRPQSFLEKRPEAFPERRPEAFPERRPSLTFEPSVKKPGSLTQLSFSPPQSLDSSERNSSPSSTTTAPFPSFSIKTANQPKSPSVSHSNAPDFKPLEFPEPLPAPPPTPASATKTPRPPTPSPPVRPPTLPPTQRPPPTLSQNFPSQFSPTPPAPRQPAPTQTPPIQFGFSPVPNQSRPFTAFANGLPPQLGGSSRNPQFPQVPPVNQPRNRFSPPPASNPFSSSSSSRFPPPLPSPSSNQFSAPGQFPPPPGQVAGRFSPQSQRPSNFQTSNQRPQTFPQTAQRAPLNPSVSGLPPPSFQTQPFQGQLGIPPALPSPSNGAPRFASQSSGNPSGGPGNQFAVFNPVHFRRA